MPSLVNYPGINPARDVLTYVNLAHCRKAFMQIFSDWKTLQGLTKSSMWPFLNNLIANTDKNVCLKIVQYR